MTVYVRVHDVGSCHLHIVASKINHDVAVKITTTADATASLSKNNAPKTIEREQISARTKQREKQTHTFFHLAQRQF